VYDYGTGILDWKTAGLPVEGTNAQLPRLVDVVRRDVPTCSLGERLGDVRDHRPFVPVAELRGIMSDRNLESSPVTTSDGRLVGLVRRQDVGLGTIDP
jgi:hypothetical protein